MAPPGTDPTPQGAAPPGGCVGEGVRELATWVAGAVLAAAAWVGWQLSPPVTLAAGALVVVAALAWEVRRRTGRR